METNESKKQNTGSQRREQSSKEAMEDSPETDR
jgi:hypothetical protein